MRWAAPMFSKSRNALWGSPNDGGISTIPATSWKPLTGRLRRSEREISFRLVLLLQLFEPIVFDERVAVILRATVRDAWIQAIGL